MRRGRNPARPPREFLPSSTLNDPPAALYTPLPSALFGGHAQALAWGLGALILSGFFSTLEESLRRSLPARVLGHPRAASRRDKLTPLLDRAAGLTTSAAILKVTCDILFVALLLGWITRGDEPTWTALGWTVAIAAPVLLLFTVTLPGSAARAFGDRLLIGILPLFALVQVPVGALVVLHDAARGVLQRLLHLPAETADERLLVEGLRGLAEVAGDKGELEEDELELVMNVMEFGDVDAAEVMTPRTEIHALAVESSIEEAAALFTEVGHSRVPVFEEKVDNIIGTLSALDVIEVFSAGSAPPLIDLLRPPLLVPETKLVSELLTEFRAGKQKMAIVLDEYGGTAGVVTLTDVLEEIVGDIQDEDELAVDPVRELGDGVFEVLAGLHVSEVNEALNLTIPEEADFETLAGFVLAELGHFPNQGESFDHEAVRYAIGEATDRRVLKVHISKIQS